MPMIKIEFDDSKLGDDEVKRISEATQKIVSESTGIEDVFVYANSARVKVQVAPIEVFVEMSDNKIDNLDELTSKIKDGISEWKKENNFSQPVNLTVIPVRWKVEVNI